MTKGKASGEWRELRPRGVHSRSQCLDKNFPKDMDGLTLHRLKPQGILSVSSITGDGSECKRDGGYCHLLVILQRMLDLLGRWILSYTDKLIWKQTLKETQWWFLGIREENAGDASRHYSQQVLGGRWRKQRENWPFWVRRPDSGQIHWGSL
jgi:hypothetical protein